MFLPDQWPLEMEARPGVVEVFDGHSVRSFDTKAGRELPVRGYDAGGAVALGHDARVDLEEIRLFGVLVHRAFQFVVGRARYETPASAAWVGGEWWVAVGDQVVRTTDQRRWTIPGLRRIAPAGRELVVVSDGELSRWNGGTRRCSLALDGSTVTQVVANTQNVVVATRRGALALDDACVPVATTAARDTRWAFDGADLWAYDGAGLERVAVTELTPTEDVVPGATVAGWWCPRGRSGGCAASGEARGARE